LAFPNPLQKMRNRPGFSMHVAERIAALRPIAIFAKLADAAIGQIAAACKWQTYDAGPSIVGFEDNSSDILFLVAGKVRVVNYSADGKTVVFVDLAAPAMFGEIAAIDRRQRSASVESLGPCTICSLSARDFEQLILREGPVAIAVLQHMAAEVRRLTQLVFEFSTMVVQNRVQAELVRLAAETGKTVGEVVLSPAPSLSDIADRISTHREAVSRELSRLAGLGVIRRAHGDLRIENVERLIRLVTEARRP
jgi:CRP-like cAMP-binding protein